MRAISTERPNRIAGFGLGILLAIGVTSAFAENPVVQECVSAAKGPSRFERALERANKPRLDRFRNSTANRYVHDAEVQAIAEKIASGEKFNIQSVFPKIVGQDLQAVRTGNEVEINIPFAMLADDSKEGHQAYNTHSAGLSAHFLKLMTGVLLGAERIVAKDPGVRVLKIGSRVVNEKLANLLVDLGFETPLFGRLLTKEEIHFIVVEGKFPPTLYEFAERLRTESAEMYAKLTSPDYRPTPEEKVLLSIPVELKLELE